MKKIFIAFAGILLLKFSFAQTPEDALRYSWLPATGTARVQSLGGASGAIGGEISTIFSNPANIGFYKTGDLAITAGINLGNNTSTYYGDKTKSTHTNGFLGTTGFVFGKPSYRGGSVKSSAFGIAINKTADFNNRTEIFGTNKQSTMATMFIEDYKKYGSGNPYGSELAYNTFWIDSSGNTLISPAQGLVSSGLLQNSITNTNGGITEFAIAGGTNINDRVYIGGSIGLPMLRYESERFFTEADPTNNINNFDYASFEDNLSTKGVGINAKLGIVVKPSNNFRVGLAFHTPTFYSLTDNYSAYVEANTEKYTTLQQPRHAESDVLVSEYNITTPYKLMGSFTALFGNVNDVRSQKGFITGDIEYVNYMASKFTSSNDSYKGYFKTLNQAVDNAYKGAVNARLGLELKFNTIAARIGGAYYGNPYKDIAGEKGDIIQGTAGIGYRNRGYFIDLGFVQNFGSNTVFPYRLTSAPFSGANVKDNSTRIMLTFGIKI